MQLPYLKEHKWPRVAKPMEEKHVGDNGLEQMEDFCLDEMFDAVMNKDMKLFRQAFETLVRNCFEYGEPKDAAI